MFPCLDRVGVFYGFGGIDQADYGVAAKVDDSPSANLRPRSIIISESGLRMYPCR